MAKFNGTNFKLFIDASTDVEFDEQSELTIDVASATIDYTSKDSGGWAENGHGLRSWSGSCNLIVDSQQLVKKQYKDVFFSITNRELLNVIAKTTTPLAGDFVFTGVMKVDSLNFSAPMEDKVTASFNFTGTGELVLTQVA
jgi:TP901-1 family phage major tail protein